MKGPELISPVATPILPEADSMPSPTGAKTLALLALLSQHPEGLTAAEAARSSGFTQNLVFRILKTMVEMGFAAQREDNKAYVLTNRVLELTTPRVGEKSLALCAHEALRWLRDESGETVQLFVETEDKGIVLEQFRGTHALQVSGQVGMRVPLYSCAPGKAILSAWNDDRREQWFQRRGNRMKAFTSTTRATREQLEEDLAAIAQRGFAIDLAEGVEGIHCVAVAIADEYGQPAGAITVMAPIARMGEEDFPRLGELCQEAACKIERNLRA